MSAKPATEMPDEKPWRAEIVRLGYSVNPWRLLINGHEVSMPQWFDHPTTGMTLIQKPVSAPTKREVTQMALDLLAQLVGEKAGPGKDD